MRSRLSQQQSQELLKKMKNKLSLFDRCHFLFHKHICVRIPGLKLKQRLSWIPGVKEMKGKDFYNEWIKKNNGQ